MKKIVFLTFISLTFFTLFPQTIQYDTISRLQVGMGIYHTKIVEYTRPWSINVLEVDLNVPYNTIETVASNDRITGFEKTSSMARRRSFPGHTVVGAVNGDFYGGSGTPISLQARDGNVLVPPIDKSIIGFNTLKKPFLSRVSLSGSVSSHIGVRNINTINGVRSTDFLVIYNKYYGTNTATNSFGSELRLKPLSSTVINDTIIYIVTQKIQNAGSMPLNDSTIVLSGHGASAAFVNLLSVGDTLKVVTRLNNFNTSNMVMPGILEAIGGFPRIINNGVNYVDQGYQEENGPSHTYELHPRTAAGFNSDSTKIYFVTVDGRQTISAGMTLKQLADFMILIGVHHAVNLDGGGSTTMVVRDSVVNSPSDGGGERTVANALLIVNSSPQGTLNNIKTSPSNIRLYRGESIQMRVFGFDEYFNPVQINQSQVVYTVNPALGSVDINGIFTASQTPGTGFLYAQYQSFRDSVPVFIKGIHRVEMSPVEAVTDKSRPIQFTVKSFDIDGVIRPVALTEMTWTVTDVNIASVNSSGVVNGKNEGVTSVIVEYQGVKDTSVVTIEIGEGTSLIQSFDSLQGFVLGGENINLAQSNISLSSSIKTEGANSQKLYYNFTYNSSVTAWAIIKTDLRIFGVPDTILMDVRSNGQQHHVTYIVNDENDEPFRITMPYFVTDSAFFKETSTAVSRIAQVNPGSSLYFPLRLKEIQVRLGSSRINGQLYTGEIYFDNLRLVYPNTVVSVLDPGLMPDSDYLSRNYPNPFNPSTKIKFAIKEESDIRLSIFNSIGEEVEVLIRGTVSPGYYEAEWRANDFPSGVYFYRLQTPKQDLTGKMMLLK